MTQLISQYSDVISKEKHLNEQRIILLNEYLKVYETQNDIDVCIEKSYIQSFKINEIIYNLYFDENNQLKKVEKLN